ncbi:MAG: hypothetical protein CMLOHMNK_01343 [Steroidobacteraceae bacterium]|nr:hypothetical protein [Steroidobacteraceae bacterium]
MHALYGFTFPGLWVAWMLGWYLASFRTKPAVRLESRASRLGHVVPLIIAGGLMASPVPSLGPIDARFIDVTRAWFWTCAAITAAGLLFAVWARVHMGRNWSGMVTVKEDHTLVTSGPYALARHPIYTGLIVAFLGSALVLGNGRGMLAFLVATIALVRKLRLEEAWMQQTFGEAYAAYRARVRAIIPFVI